MVNRLNAAGDASIELVGYVPETAYASPAFKHIARTAQTTDFSVLEPVQIWIDLLASGIHPAQVTLLCLGGGNISAQEVALGARVAALADSSQAANRFAALLEKTGELGGNGILLPPSSSALVSFIW